MFFILQYEYSMSTSQGECMKLDVGEFIKLRPSTTMILWKWAQKSYFYQCRKNFDSN